jgi:hypothetical protein
MVANQPTVNWPKVLGSRFEADLPHSYGEVAHLAEQGTTLKIRVSLKKKDREVTLHRFGVTRSRVTFDSA